MIIFDPNEFMRSGAGPAFGTRVAEARKRMASFLKRLLKRSRKTGPVTTTAREQPGERISPPVLPQSRHSPENAARNDP